jgi:hypothetical protein
MRTSSSHRLMAGELAMLLKKKVLRSQSKGKILSIIND